MEARRQGAEELAVVEARSPPRDREAIVEARSPPRDRAEAKDQDQADGQLDLLEGLKDVMRKYPQKYQEYLQQHGLWLPREGSSYKVILTRFQKQYYIAQFPTTF